MKNEFISLAWPVCRITHGIHSSNFPIYEHSSQMSLAKDLIYVLNIKLNSTAFNVTVFITIM